jgi:hypothetical protein
MFPFSPYKPLLSCLFTILKSFITISFHLLNKDITNCTISFQHLCQLCIHG